MTSVSESYFGLSRVGGIYIYVFSKSKDLIGSLTKTMNLDKNKHDEEGGGGFMQFDTLN